MLKTALGRLRIVGLIEGVSYLVLLGIAMPLKYLADIPIAVTIAGGLHGLLFILFVLALAEVKFRHHWHLQRAFIAFILSLIPFGNFVLDKSLRQDQEMLTKNT